MNFDELLKLANEAEARRAAKNAQWLEQKKAEKVARNHDLQTRIDLLTPWVEQVIEELLRASMESLKDVKVHFYYGELSHPEPKWRQVPSDLPVEHLALQAAILNVVRETERGLGTHTILITLTSPNKNTTAMQLEPSWCALLK